MRNGLSPSDLGDFLEQPVVAILATHRTDGTVLLSPVWHEWRDGGFSVATTSGDVKLRHLAGNPNASIVVAESSPPYRGIELRCTPRAVPDTGGEVSMRLAVRYLGEERGRAYAATLGDDMVIRLEPGALRVWDFADEL